MKNISLTSSIISNVAIEREVGSPDEITVVGYGVDGDGNEYPVKNMVMLWDDLPQNVKNTGDNFLKHLSREFNKQVAEEDSDTW